MAEEIGSGTILDAEKFETENIKVFAGPGAGKTYFLVQNIKNLIQKSQIFKSSKYRKVLCITYTNAAVNEIMGRLNLFTGECEISTIHGFIIENIIKPFQKDLRALMKSDFGIEVTTNKMITSQVEGLGILHGLDKKEIFDFIAEQTGSHDVPDYNKKDMGDLQVDWRAYLESIKANSEPVHRFESEKIREEHKKPLKLFVWSEVRKLTHDEILYFGHRILEENPLALYYVRTKFPFIFVDEFQDTSPLQTLLIKKICEQSSHVCVVGDVAQSIYSFQNAKPSDFEEFNIGGKIAEYSINGNRRSSLNIVNFCNFIRRKDPNVVQKPINADSDNPKVHFLIGEGKGVKDKISEVVADGGVVITRSWAAAFKFVKDLPPDQSDLLRRIYNSYYYSPISLRDEVVEHHNVAWVRAFRFMIDLYDGRKTGSLGKVIGALRLYGDINRNGFNGKTVSLIRQLLNEVFSCCESMQICDVIDRFNYTVAKNEYAALNELIDIGTLAIHYAKEEDDTKFVARIRSLDWDTARKLFAEIFSDDSKYMTVHQAKGREWENVVVSLNTTNFDHFNLSDVLMSPNVVGEGEEFEFARLLYVACSRAKENLYVQIPGDCWLGMKISIDGFVKNGGFPIEYDVYGGANVF